MPLLRSTAWKITVKGDTDPDTGEPLLNCKARLTAGCDLVEISSIKKDQHNAPTLYP